jgi:dynein light intermediate chain 1, cytosolic
MAARQINGGKESKHNRKQSGLPQLDGTLALGYTYIDVLDEENDDILARLTFSLLPNPSGSLTPLLHETFTPSLLSQTTCVILLDWANPWRWLRDLRDWISVVMGFLHETTRSEEYERVVSDTISNCIPPCSC